MKRIAFVLALSLIGSAANACSCVAPPPPDQARERALAVFIGVPKSEHAVNKDQKRFEFEVVEVLKGDIKSSVRIVTGLGTGDCGVPFQIGFSYLVYAEGTKRTMTAHLCTRTKLLLDDSDHDEIELLRKLKEAERKPNKALEPTR